MQKKDETQKFNALYEKVFPVIIKVSYRMTGSRTVAEDLCQEAFIRYYEKFPSIPDENQAMYWLIRVVKNLTLNYQKRKQREQKAYQKYLQEPKRNPETGETQLLLDETKESIQKLLEKLPEKLKTVLVLREYGNLSYKEIAKILKITEANVKVRVFRAREAIGSMIKQGEFYVP